MAKDPAFLFYPGDYLRDTQNLSEKVQVAYDRIMCEHMRNICITQQQLKFFTKRLSEDEIEELMMMLTQKEGGYQIQWVAESIEKRKAYSESRRNNRKRKNKSHMKTYVTHMENEIENEDIIKEVKNNGVPEKLLESVNTYFGIDHTNANAQKEILQRLNLIVSTGYLEQFENQFKAYQKFKEETKQQKHSWIKFLGTYEKKCQDGAWIMENWINKSKTKEITHI